MATATDKTKTHPSSEGKDHSMPSKMIGDPKEVRVPGWVATVVKVSIPALIVLIGAYAGYLTLKQEVCRLSSQVPQLEMRVLELERDNFEVSTDTKLFKESVSEALVRIEKSITELRTDVRDVSGSQQMILTDVRVIQEKLKKDNP